MDAMRNGSTGGGERKSTRRLWNKPTLYIIETGDAGVGAAPAAYEVNYTQHPIS